MSTDRDDETVQTQTPTSGHTGPARDSRPSVPAMLGRYRVIKLLGRGGVGAVYEAEDPEVGRRVAIKVLREDREGDTEALRGEAQALGRLVHPNVVTVYDVGVVGGEVFLVMQLVDGEPLDRWLASRTVEAKDILALFRQSGLGLAAAHSAGLVHCDFKPGNILVDHHGVARVSDFGLARTTRAHDNNEAIASASMVSISGTPAYMAPEQFDGVATPATDQFSFCVALWEVLAGERPFDDSSIHATDIHAARGPLRELPPSSRIPAHLVATLQRGLAADPKDRFPSMEALLAELARPVPRRYRHVFAVSALVAIAFAVVGYAVVRDRQHTAPAWSAADVASARALTSGACDDSPVIDPSGVVVFGRTIGDEVDVYTVPLAGGAVRRLTTAPTWDWRPNSGRRAGEVIHLVHDATTATGASLAYLDVVTGVVTPASAVYAWDAVVAGDAIVYSPDEPAGIRHLVERRDLALLDAPSGYAYVLVAASPTRDRLAVTKTTANNGPTYPCVVDLATRVVTCLPGRSSDGRPAFGADGRALYYAAPDGLRRRDLATGAEVVFFPKVWSEGGMAVAPDGSALVYSHCRQINTIVDVGARPPVVFLPGPDVSEVAFSSTGMVVWVRDVNGVQTLEARTSDGRELQLTDAAFGSVKAPAFSPDGAQIVFAASEPNPGIHTLRVANPGAPHRITGDARDQTPQWTASGAIAFSRPDAAGNHVFVVSAGGEARMLVAATRTLYASRGDELLVDTGEPGTTSLRWLAAATGVERSGPVRPEGYVKTVAISANGAWIAVAMGINGHDVWRARLEPAGPLEHVTTLPPSSTSSAIAITDDGRALATQNTWAGGLFVIPARPGTRF